MRAVKSKFQTIPLQFSLPLGMQLFKQNLERNIALPFSSLGLVAV
jgi:hypothetical protein